MEVPPEKDDNTDIIQYSILKEQNYLISLQENLEKLKYLNQSIVQSIEEFAIEGREIESKYQRLFIEFTARSKTELFNKNGGLSKEICPKLDVGGTLWQDKQHFMGETLKGFDQVYKNFDNLNMEFDETVISEQIQLYEKQNETMNQEAINVKLELQRCESVDFEILEHYNYRIFQKFIGMLEKPGAKVYLKTEKELGRVTNNINYLTEDLSKKCSHS